MNNIKMKNKPNLPEERGLLWIIYLIENKGLMSLASSFSTSETFEPLQSEDLFKLLEE